MAQLKPRFDAKRGTLDWYCVDHWSEELGLDIPALKHALRDEIRYLDGAAEFLDLLRGLGKRVLLTTNAHPISLRVKDGQTRLSRHFDELISSHEFGVPKEHPEFWARLARAHGVDAARTLFVDDSAAVLQAARSARVASQSSVRCASSASSAAAAALASPQMPTSIFFTRPSILWSASICTILAFFTASLNALTPSRPNA
jgi:HAD superfamily hydrolase (TIGR01509 family)